MTDKEIRHAVTEEVLKPNNNMVEFILWANIGTLDDLYNLLLVLGFHSLHNKYMVVLNIIQTRKDKPWLQ